MRKQIFCAVVSAAFFLSCSDNGKNSPAGAGNDTSAQKHGLTITDPSAHEPHTVKDSVYNGEHVERYPNGVIYMRGDVQGGLRVGEWLTFYKSGKLWSQGTYAKGLRQGYGVSYYENGQKSSEGYYKDDKMIGLWKFWDEYGTMKQRDFGE